MVIAVERAGNTTMEGNMPSRRKADRVSGTARRRLRARAHALKPVVIVGTSGVTARVIGALEQALQDHALIKIRVNANDRHHRRALISELCAACHAELIHSIGHVAVLFREPEDESLREALSQILD